MDHCAFPQLAFDAVYSSDLLRPSLQVTQASPGAYVSRVETNAVVLDPDREHIAIEGHRHGNLGGARMAGCIMQHFFVEEKQVASELHVEGAMRKRIRGAEEDAPVLKE